MKSKCKKCKDRTSTCDHAPCGKVEAKVPRRIWHGIGASGKLTHSYLLTKKEVDYYAKKNCMEFVKYVLAGTKRREVVGELKKFINGKLKYYNNVINDPDFVHDESGHWDTGSRHAYESILGKLGGDGDC